MSVRMQMSKQETADKAVEYLRSGHTCSQSVLLAFKDVTGLDEQTILKIASGFGGGMGRTNGRCGALSAAFMIMGLTDGFSYPIDPSEKAAFYKKIRTLNKKQEEKFSVVNCNELLAKYPNGDEPRLSPCNNNICVKFVVSTIGDLYDMLNE